MPSLKSVLLFLTCTATQWWADQQAPPPGPPPTSAKDARRRWLEQQAREARERAGL